MNDFIKLEMLKEKLNIFRPISPDVINNLDKWFEIERTYSSNTTKGNTQKRLETVLVIENGISVGRKPLKEHFEVLNHKKALATLKALIQEQEIRLNNIFYLHKQI